jgi:hypothetical protein
MLPVPSSATWADSNRLQLELGGSCNVIIRRELGVESLGSTPTRFRHILRNQLFSSFNLFQLEHLFRLTWHQFSPSRPVDFEG